MKYLVIFYFTCTFDYGLRTFHCRISLYEEGRYFLVWSSTLWKSTYLYEIKKIFILTFEIFNWKMFFLNWGLITIIKKINVYLCFCKIERCCQSRPLRTRQISLEVKCRFQLIYLVPAKLKNSIKITLTVSII